MIIRKTFVQKYVAQDQEARKWAWEDTTEDYNELKESLMNKWNGWFDAVRIVEKVFNEDTFEITVDVIKTAMRVYKDWKWVKGEIEEE